MNSAKLNFNLIVCTYKRAESLLRLLRSVRTQSLYPDRILIIDGSPDMKTGKMLAANQFVNLEYFKVDEYDRGLTKQRNYGIKRLNSDCEIVLIKNAQLKFFITRK